MRTKYLLVTVFSIAIFAVMIVLIATGFVPPSAVDQKGSPIDSREAPAEGVDLDTSAGILTSTEPAASQMAPLQDGRSLLVSHCTRCHVIELLEKTDKSRTDWEKALGQMEAMGVHLDDAEKGILLDYLTMAGES